MFLKSYKILLILFLTFSCENACKSGVGEECREDPGRGHGSLPFSSNERCEEGLICVYKRQWTYSHSGWECARQACDGLCDLNQFCEFPAEVCRPRFKQGERCDGENAMYYCSAELNCNQGFDPPSCEPLQLPGGRCGDDEDCEMVGGCATVCEQSRCLAQTCEEPKSDAGNSDMGSDGD